MDGFATLVCRIDHALVVSRYYRRRSQALIAAEEVVMILSSGGRFVEFSAGEWWRLGAGGSFDNVTVVVDAHSRPLPAGAAFDAPGSAAADISDAGVVPPGSRGGAALASARRALGAVA